MQAYLNEGGKIPYSVGRVFTWHEGAVTEYAPAAKLVWASVSDVDGDGRPDLIGDYLGVSVAAHTLANGTFSQVDAAAQAFARRDCPPGRTAAFLPVENDEAGVPPEFSPTGWNGACARLWGATPAAVIRKIDKHCSSVDCTRKSALTDQVVDSAEIYRKEVAQRRPFSSTAIEESLGRIQLKATSAAIAHPTQTPNKNALHSS